MLETLQKMLAGEDAFTVTIHVQSVEEAICKEEAVLAADSTGIVLENYYCIPWSAISSLQINVI